MDDKSSEEPENLAESVIAGAVISGAVISGAAIAGAVSTPDTHTAPKVKEAEVHDTLEAPTTVVEEAQPSIQKVTELVDESTAHKKPNEEMITEPAPQPSDSGVHGTTVAEEAVPKVTEQAKAADNLPPTVIVSSPAVEETADAEPGRTVEIIRPTPAPQGEIFSHAVWNESVSPLLQYTLETTPEGIRRRNITGDNRPRSSGSDVVSSKHHRNFLFSFWHVFTLGWLGGVGRFFGGMFTSKRHGTPGR
ncbi:hypothetical protein EDC01DRAFT_250813 [Geopyxis carbonaria]|nr:hypothetical protein EDC01DRAFT_250813 [Geopyxis carbonaria]